jgi:hypothetical protein
LLSGSSRTTSPASPSRLAAAAATFLIVVVVLLVALFPKPENDLFFELRIGADILQTGHLPHTDIYSWVNRGTRWDVPEWFTFILYALAFREGGFFGAWLLMASVTLATVLVVWFGLLRRLGITWAFLLTNLMLLAMSDCIQERPYIFTYLLLAVSLGLLTRAREEPIAERGRKLNLRPFFSLVMISIVWTNLHQGVVVLVGLLAAYAAGDLVTAFRARTRAAQDADGLRRRAGLTLATFFACACAVMASPYGWGVYRNVFVTLHDRVLMANVTEWKPITVLPLAQLQPFLLITALVGVSLALSRKRSLSDILAVAALFLESLLHARNIALFAVGATVIGAPHFEAALDLLRKRLPISRVSLSRNFLLALFSVFYVMTVAMVACANLRRAVGVHGYSARGVGEAVARQPSYPAAACAFMRAERFPNDLRLLNNFEIGGYLMWTLPREPVFIDGRLDVYAGRTFDDMLVLARGQTTPHWTDLVRRYDFDCVVTTSKREAMAFERDPAWKLVYLDAKIPHRLRCRILLRRVPQFRQLIARCERDRPVSPETQ